jgi:hypothetical protein
LSVQRPRGTLLTKALRKYFFIYASLYLLTLNYVIAINPVSDFDDGCGNIARSRYREQMPLFRNRNLVYVFETGLR